jgi:hypothetical protein
VEEVEGALVVVVASELPDAEDDDPDELDELREEPADDDVGVIDEDLLPLVTAGDAE